MNLDPDSPDYNDTNQGDPRETPERLRNEREKMAAVCDQILDIMEAYHEQEASPRGIDTPGGLEHMGDVWGLFRKWETLLKASDSNPEPKEKELF